MKNVLVRDGRTYEMLSVLNRYNIGKEDKYNRGRWIGKKGPPSNKRKYVKR